MLACGKHKADQHVNPTLPDEILIDVEVSVVKRTFISRKLLVVGDSEACAIKPYVDDVFKKQNAAHNMPQDIINVECKVGSTVEYWSSQERFKNILNKHSKPDVVIVFLGTNHYWQNKAPDISNIVDGIENSGAQCVWIGNTAVNGKRWKINRLMRDAVASRCRYFDTEQANISLVDNAHPTIPATIKWLQLIWDVVPLKFEEHEHY